MNQTKFGIILLLQNEDLPTQIGQDIIIRSYQIPFNDEIFFTAIEFKLDSESDTVFNLLESVSQCSKIKELVLDFGWSYLGNIQINWIESIAKCQNITTLYINLESNKINAEDILLIGKSLENLINIDSLHLCFQYNNIKEQGFNYLNLSISKLKNLASLYLDLYKNQIENNEKIEFRIQECNLLTSLTLNLSQNPLQYEGAQSLGNTIQQMNQLKKLNLSLVNCQIKEGVKYIAQGVSKCHNLEYLNLNLKINNIESSEQQVGNAIGNQKKLTHLNLSFNQNQFLDSNFLGSFLCQIGSCTNLQEIKFDFNNCSIDNYGMQLLAKSISTCQNLQQLCVEIGQNFILEQGILDFLQEIASCQKIFKLALTQSGYDSLEYRRIKQPVLFGLFIKNIAKLSILQINLEKFIIEGEQFSEIVKQLKQCKKLNTLDFSFSQTQVQRYDLYGRNYVSLLKCKRLVQYYQYRCYLKRQVQTDYDYDDF